MLCPSCSALTAHPVLPWTTATAGYLQANAVPSSFWSVAFLLLPENQRHLQAVVAEAQQAVALLPGAAGAGAATAGAEAEAEAEARAGAALEGDGGAGELLTAAQQQGLVALAVDRRSYAAAAVGEALRLRSFRWGPARLPACPLSCLPSPRIHQKPPPE